MKEEELENTERLKMKLDEKLNTEKQRNEDLNGQLTGKMNDEKTPKETLNKLEDEMRKAKEIEADLQDTNNKLKIENEELRGNCDALIKQRASLEKENSLMKETVALQEMELENAEGMKMKLDEKLNTEKQRKEDLNGQLAGKMNDEKTLKERLNKLEDEIRMSKELEADLLLFFHVLHGSHMLSPFSFQHILSSHLLAHSNPARTRLIRAAKM
ncbi:hypothetical protein SK128_014859 [Halocaridina rubra]|uniref:Uncharacterized protein n=1 Tax=Halocaridina rubra TaxID=373956 RepID=A0AAN8XJL1_HALRR